MEDMPEMVGLSSSLEDAISQGKFIVQADLVEVHSLVLILILGSAV